MLRAYLPILILFLVAFGFAAFAVVASYLLGQRKPTRVKIAPYECGISTPGYGKTRIPLRYYTVAMLFLLFDLEVVFLYPWAVTYKKLGLFGLVEMMVFIGILLVGYVYVWKKGALEWD